MHLADLTESISSAKTSKQEVVIRRSNVFDKYVLFRSLPKLLLYPPKDRLTGIRPTPLEFATALGIEDENILEAIELKTQKNFAYKHGVTEQTLGRWNKLIAKRDTVTDLRIWGQGLSSNVLFALYRKIIQGKALPADYRFWYQYVDGWSEKMVSAENQRKINTITVTVVKNVNLQGQ